MIDVEWPLRVDDHLLARTSRKDQPKTRVACRHCGSSANISPEDTGINTTLDDVVVLLTDRLPEHCQPITTHAQEGKL